MAGLGGDVAEEAMVDRAPGPWRRARRRPRSPHSRRRSPARADGERRRSPRPSPRARARRAGAAPRAGPTGGRGGRRAPPRPRRACAPAPRRRRPVPRPTQSEAGPPNSAAKIAAAMVVLPIPISPMQRRSIPPATASMPKAMVAAQSASSIAASAVMSPVGISSARSSTLRPRSLARQIWLMAAPPRAKFSTICSVTSAGIGRDAAGGDAMIAGEDRHHRPIDHRRRPALPGGEPDHDLLEPAERAGRLGEHRVARPAPPRPRRGPGPGMLFTRARMSSKGMAEVWSMQRGLVGDGPAAISWPRGAEVL